MEAMAGEENFAECPLCFCPYEVEGEHVPCILPCFHSVCRQCIREDSCQESGFECPECGKASVIQKIQRNEYIISQMKKFAVSSSKLEHGCEKLKTKCSRHEKDQSLFCKESKCQVPICIMCLKDEHKGHDFTDLHEMAKGKCSTVLEKIESARNILEKKKSDMLQTQKVVTENYEHCAVEVLEAKAELNTDIDNAFAKLMSHITEQQTKANASINEKVACIDKDLAMLDGLEQITDIETIFEMEAEKLERLKIALDEIKSKSSEATNCCTLQYIKCTNKFQYLSHLCGKLAQKDKEQMNNCTISNDSELHENTSVSGESQVKVTSVPENTQQEVSSVVQAEVILSSSGELSSQNNQTPGVSSCTIAPPPTVNQPDLENKVPEENNYQGQSTAKAKYDVSTTAETLEINNNNNNNNSDFLDCSINNIDLSTVGNISIDAESASAFFESLESPGGFEAGDCLPSTSGIPINMQPLAEPVVPNQTSQESVQSKEQTTRNQLSEENVNNTTKPTADDVTEAPRPNMGGTQDFPTQPANSGVQTVGEPNPENNGSGQLPSLEPSADTDFSAHSDSERGTPTVETGASRDPRPHTRTSATRNAEVKDVKHDDMKPVAKKRRVETYPQKQNNQQGNRQGKISLCCRGEILQ